MINIWSQHCCVRAPHIHSGNQNRITSASLGILVHEIALHSVRDERKRVDSLHLGASLAVVNLVAPLTALVGPREVGDGDEEERVAGVGDTGEGVVPWMLLVRVRIASDFMV